MSGGSRLRRHRKSWGGVRSSQKMKSVFFDCFYVMPPLTHGGHYSFAASELCPIAEMAMRMLFLRWNREGGNEKASRVDWRRQQKWWWIYLKTQRVSQFFGINAKNAPLTPPVIHRSPSRRIDGFYPQKFTFSNLFRASSELCITGA